MFMEAGWRILIHTNKPRSDPRIFDFFFIARRIYRRNENLFF